MSIKSRILDFFTEPEGEEDLVTTTASSSEPLAAMTVVLTSGRQFAYNAFSEEDVFVWLQRAMDASNGAFDTSGLYVSCGVGGPPGKFDASAVGIAPAAIESISIDTSAELYSRWVSQRTTEGNGAEPEVNDGREEDASE